jgi:hypothetical protein
MSKLDRLHLVELCDVWQKETQDFTPGLVPLRHNTRRHT